MRNLLYKIRNSLSPASISILAIGVGVTMASAFAPIGWHIPVAFARTLTGIGVGLIVFGFILMTCKYFKSPIEKKNRIYSIISILSNMEGCLWKLARKQRFENTDWQKYIETNNKISQLLDIAEPKVTSVDEAKEKIAGLESALGEKTFIKDQPLSKRVEVLQSFSRLLDIDSFGLKEQRESNKAYLRLNKRVDKYYDNYKDIIDRDLDILIKAHKAIAEAGANIFLVKQRLLYLREQILLQGGLGNELTDILDLFPPHMQAWLEGFETDAKDILRDKRIEISQHIRGIK
jgi:hypothetical protein